MHVDAADTLMENSKELLFGLFQADTSCNKLSKRHGSPRLSKFNIHARSSNFLCSKTAANMLIFDRPRKGNQYLNRGLRRLLSSIMQEGKYCIHDKKDYLLEKSLTLHAFLCRIRHGS